MRAGGRSAVLKLVALDAGPHPRWPSREDPSDPYWWQREPVAYQSGLLEPFGVPRVLACLERRDGAIALWLEDAGDELAWTPALLAGAAERLGQAQRALVGVDAPWLARSFLPAYLELHGADAPDPRLRELPQTICHNDFHPGNVLESGLVVDWAYCGVGAAGLDAGVLVVDGVSDDKVPPELADEVADAVWEGYLRGFGDASARLGFVEGVRRLRWLPRGHKSSWDVTLDLIERLASGG